MKPQMSTAEEHLGNLGDFFHIATAAKVKSKMETSMSITFLNKGSPSALLHEAIEHDPDCLAMAYRTKDGRFRCVASRGQVENSRLLLMGLAAQLLADITAAEG